MSWKAQVKFFVDKGYYVIIPDMRGYNTSDKPEGITQRYRVHTLI
jgi:predicted acyl esterase